MPAIGDFLREYVFRRHPVVITDLFAAQEIAAIATVGDAVHAWGAMRIQLQEEYTSAEGKSHPDEQVVDEVRRLCRARPDQSVVTLVLHGVRDPGPYPCDVSLARGVHGGEHGDEFRCRRDLRTAQEVRRLRPDDEYLHRQRRERTRISTSTETNARSFSARSTDASGSCCSTRLQRCTCARWTAPTHARLSPGSTSRRWRMTKSSNRSRWPTGTTRSSSRARPSIYRCWRGTTSSTSRTRCQ